MLRSLDAFFFLISSPFGSCMMAETVKLFVFMKHRLVNKEKLCFDKLC